MPDSSANLALPYLMPAQAQKHVTHNEALRILDAVVQLAVESRSLAVPPAAPAQGARHVVPDGASGIWTGQGGRLAVWQDTAWIFLTPRPGWRAAVLDENIEILWRDGAWQALSRPGLDDIETLGINAAADTANRLAVASPGTLLNHEGAGHRLKINKAAPADTASLLFQTGFSGRAEMGTAGDDGFSIRVSADGDGWTTALRADPASGVATCPQGARIDGALTGSGVVGTVAQAGGAVIERGATADGRYVRFADGTQICTHVLNADAAGPVDWTFPVAFAAVDAVSGVAQATGPRIVVFDAVSATGAAMSAFATDETRRTPPCHLTATGRWF